MVFAVLPVELGISDLFVISKRDLPTCLTGRNQIYIVSSGKKIWYSNELASPRDSRESRHISYNPRCLLSLSGGVVVENTFTDNFRVYFDFFWQLNVAVGWDNLFKYVQ